MLWGRYAGVAGLLILTGTLIGAALFLVAFAFLIPPDRGEESVVPLMPIVGGLIGAVLALAPSLAFLLGLFAWTRRAGRSVRSRAWVGAGAAGAGAAVLWVAVGLASNSISAWAGPIAVISAVIAACVAGPLTVRAARRADERAAADPARPGRPADGAVEHLA